MRKHSVLKKVDINELMDVMMELWTKGVDYVDIIIKPEENSIALMFTEDYLSEDAKDRLAEMEDDEGGADIDHIELKSKLTDEDLNQLL